MNKAKGCIDNLFAYLQRYLVEMPPLPKKKKRNYAQLTLRQGIFLWAKVDGVCNELRVPAIPPPQAPLMSE